jgi:4-hydroxy-tetrahydrodipicolinate synthase
MQYQKKDAKAYAQDNLRGIWAANLTPFDHNFKLDEDAYRANLKHWMLDLKLAGLFIAGKQAEFYAMSLPERKRIIDIAVDMSNQVGDRNGLGRCEIMSSCSDTNMDVVLDLAQHSEKVGADYIVVHSPLLHFGAHTDDTIFEYYKYLCDHLDIGIAMWNHPDCGYIMSPELCARIAALNNIVAIKYSTDRERCKRLTELAGHIIHVSNPSEEEWLDNIIDFGWKLYLCSTPPFLLQSKSDQRMNEYTALAFAGKFDLARAVRNSLNPVREAFKRSKPDGKPQAHAKCWQDLLGQHGGLVRRPLLQMTAAEREATAIAFDSCGLKV